MILKIQEERSTWYFRGVDRCEVHLAHKHEDQGPWKVETGAREGFWEPTEFIGGNSPWDYGWLYAISGEDVSDHLVVNLESGGRNGAWLMTDDGDTIERLPDRWVDAE